MRLLLSLPVGLLLLSGCHHADTVAQSQPSTSVQKEEKPADPMEAARQGIHEGAFQLSNAAQDLQAAIDAAKSLMASTKNPDLKVALRDILDGLDDAGGSIADFTAEPPALEQFKKEFDAQDKSRLDGIDGANDALHDVNDATDAIGDFDDNPAPEDGKALDDLDDALSDATDDLTLAIKAFGGKVEEDDTQDVTPGADTKTDPGVAPTASDTAKPNGPDL